MIWKINTDILSNKIITSNYLFKNRIIRDYLFQLNEDKK
ncbi:MAG: hypothetical protein MRERV_9c022 [Mycoplasmataceae bacterium RV_VA103A]|nr:MAG: hypothetical protein MRERV_9c022 [Mycoplasmataceae bacterium RV_VA103A]